MALNRSSKFGAEEGLFASKEENSAKEEPVVISKQNVVDTTVKTYKKKKEEIKPTKKRIHTKSRTYTIDDELYAQLNACVQILRDNDVKNEENGSLISESAFIRKAIRTEIQRLKEVNGPEFEQQIQTLLHTPVITNRGIKY